MKQLKLKTLALRNFKGIDSFVVQPDGGNVRIYGDNATGKTTLFDAFTWLLFGKDSQNKKDFAIKKLDENNNEVHNLDHEVEATFTLDESNIKLRKVYNEKWTKKRGSATKEFTGHNTDHYIDDVPSKKKEFEEKASEIIDEDVFKLLTSPSYFNEQLHWSKRRELLIELAGDVTENEVVKKNPDLQKLLDEMQGRTIEDHKKVIAAKRKEINQELERIPVRIDEVHHSRPDISNLDKETLQSEIEHIQSLIDEKEEERNRIKSGSEVTELNKRLAEKETQLLNIKNKQADLNHNKTSGKRTEYNNAIRARDDKEREISRLQSEIEAESKQLNQLEEEKNELRGEWKKENDKEFEATHEENCPTCGQSLPEEQIKEAHDKALTDFNRRKSEELERINAIGKQKKEAAEKLSSDIEQFENDLQQAKQDLSEKSEAVEKLKADLAELESNTTDYQELPEFKEKQKEKAEIQEQINQLKQNAEESIASVDSEITKLKSERKELEADMSKFDQFTKVQERVEELEAQQEKLGEEFEQLEQQLYLAETFIRTKVELLTSKINDRFDHANFKLFKENINGGLEETCETLYQGVPYSAGLNNAARINVGLDIINTLSDYYGIQVPIFIDNSEAVTKLIDVDAQIVSLVVSEEDKELRVEHAEEMELV